MRQGYLSLDVDRTIRIRVADDRAYLTIKGRKVGATAPEFEYPIPVDDANQMLEQLCLGTSVDKVRYRHPAGEHVWEVDVFSGRNEGLVLAEIELTSEHDEFQRPEWLGSEVTSDFRYANSRLAETPFQEWTDS